MQEPSKNHKVKSGIFDSAKNYIFIAVIWLLLTVLGWVKNGPFLLRGELKGPDDHMRLAQIRDWLDGQAWYDLHQYRLNPVDPLVSHWSRVSDVLIGIPIKILTPLVGQQSAELFSVVFYPSVLLFVFLVLTVKLTARLTKHSDVLLATGFMTALSFTTLQQFELGRIDHHGLQIVFALACCLAIIKSKEHLKYSILAGVLCGTGLFIGIESAPYVGAACVCAVLIWIFDEHQSEKRLRLFGLAMAVTTLICLAIGYPPSQWFTPSCDALSIVYTQLTLIVSLIMYALAYSSRFITGAPKRLIAAAILGSLALLLTVFLFPQCLKGPYADVDPRLSEFWLANVSEAKNFVKFVTGKPVSGIGAILLPVFSILGYLIYHKRTGDGLSIAPRSVIIFVLFALLAGLIQFRIMSFTASLAVPFAAYLLICALEWSAKFEGRIKPILARLSSFILLAPITIPLIIGFAIQEEQDEPAATFVTMKPACVSKPVLSNLEKLPPESTALSFIDLGAPILLHSEISVTSAPYHRNTVGNTATLDFFMGDEASARAAIKATGADHVIACREFPETYLWVRNAPDGMLAQLLANDIPNWLEKIEMDEDDNLLVYRIINDQSDKIDE